MPRGVGAPSCALTLITIGGVPIFTHKHIKKNTSTKLDEQKTTQLAKMSIDPKFVEHTADVFQIILYNGQGDRRPFPPTVFEPLARVTLYLTDENTLDQGYGIVRVMFTLILCCLCSGSGSLARV